MFKKTPTALVDLETIRPCGVKDCLKNLTFVRTGELKTMSSEQLKLYIQTYSGKCTEAVSGKTSYLIQAQNPGVKKTEEAKKKGIKIITEDQFFQLVVQLSSKLDKQYAEELPLGNYEFSLKPFGNSLLKQESEDENKIEKDLLQFRFPKLTCKDDMISNQNVYVSMLEYLISDKHKQTCLFVYGPSGSGKSALVKCLCQQNNIQLVYVDQVVGIQDFKEQMKVFYTPQFNLQHKKTILAIDNPEQCHAACYRYLLNVLSNNKKNPTSQMILISADWHNQKSQTLMKYCECFQLKRASKILICRYLTGEFAKQMNNKEISSGYFDILSNKCNGDIRQLQHLLLMPIYNNIHNVNQYAHNYINEDYSKIVDHVFKFQHYIRENPTGIVNIMDAFYQNAAVIYASIIQNYQKYVNNDLNYIYEISQCLSLADLIAYRMMQINDWQGSRSCATQALIIPGLLSSNIMPIGYIMPAFPSIINLKQQIANQQTNSYYIMNDTILDLESQHEFFETAMNVMEQLELNEEEEFNHYIYINQDIVQSDVQLSKKMKAYIKNNAIDNIQELNENVKKATNNKKQEK